MLAIFMVILAIANAIFLKRKGIETLWKVALCRGGLLWAIGAQGLLAAITYAYIPANIALWLGYIAPGCDYLFPIVSAGLAMAILGLLGFRNPYLQGITAAAGLIYFAGYASGYLNQLPGTGFVAITLGSLAWVSYVVVPFLLCMLTAWDAFTRWRKK